MANKSLLHSSLTDNIFYRSMLAGNEAYFPEFESDDFLEEVVLTSSATSVTFSGLDAYSDYKHLQIRMIARSTYNNTSSDLYMRFNGATTNYFWHRLYGSGNSVASGALASQDRIGIGFPPAATNGTGVFGGFVTDILDFSSGSKNTTVRSLNGFMGTTGNKYVSLNSGAWGSTAAVTSLEIGDYYGGGLAQYSRFSLYGSKG